MATNRNQSPNDNTVQTTDEQVNNSQAFSHKQRPDSITPDNRTAINTDPFLKEERNNGDKRGNSNVSLGNDETLGIP